MRPLRGVVCERCWAQVARHTPPLCVRCGEPLPSWRVLSLASSWCPRCRRRGSALTAQRSVGPYEGRLRDILHAFKYDGRRSLARPLAALVHEASDCLLEDADASVPVPLHRSKRRSRGFNQSLDLAGGLGLPVVQALRRTRRTPPQVSLPAALRHRNVRGAFVLAPVGIAGAAPAAWRMSDRLRAMRIGLAGRCVVLVDDVCTTGATLEACARVLIQAGVAEVRAVTVARAAPPRAAGW